MSDSMILHHYENSPYAEKIRLMFGLTGSRWLSVLSPVQPPRPALDPLTGGYRRIPVAQQGADLFCDTALIAAEIAEQTGNPLLNVQSVDETARALMDEAEKQAFFAAIGAVAPLRLLTTIVSQFGPVGAIRFVRDRKDMLKGGTVRPPQGAKAQAVLHSFLSQLEAHLADQPWVAGEAASIADFACYHPLWLHVSCDRRPLKAGPRVCDWYARIEHIGHGQRQNISADTAFAAARDSNPRPVPESHDLGSLSLQSPVNVAPSDYGITPVSGSLAAITHERIIVARDTAQFGCVHVHFPREGYSITAA